MIRVVLSLLFALVLPLSAQKETGAVLPELEPTWFGTAVDGAGDVNLDGYGDVVVGAWWFEGKRGMVGKVVVYSGHDGSVLHEIEGKEPGALFGLAVAGAGDADDDGAGDFAIGAPLSAVSGRPAGAAWLYSGRTGKLLETVEPDKRTSAFGLSIAGAGDLNQDGFDDFVVGAPGGGLDGSEPGDGRVIAFSGRGGKKLEQWEGARTGDGFGWSVDGAGDVNGDGSGDVVIGAWRDSRTLVVSGKGGKVLHEGRGAEGTRRGFAVAGAGDTDQDGFSDVLFGVPQGTDDGAILLSVKKETVLQAFPRELESGVEGWGFGLAVDGAGDVDGDGFADVIVGDPGIPALRDAGGELGAHFGRLRAGAARPGRAFVYSGKGKPLFTLDGVAPDDAFGVRVRGAGDVNQDGRADVVVASGGGSDVVARVFAGPDGKLLYQLRLP